jgi:hypothetical protein
MSSIPPPNSVPNCGCQHKEPANLICAYALPNTCGGPTYCGYCRANNPPANELPPPPPMPLTLDATSAGEFFGRQVLPDTDDTEATDDEADSGKFGWLSLLDDDAEADSGKKPESGE